MCDLPLPLSQSNSKLKFPYQSRLRNIRDYFCTHVWSGNFREGKKQTEQAEKQKRKNT